MWIQLALDVPLCDLAQVQLPEAAELLEAARDQGWFGVDGAGLLIVGVFASLGLFRGLWWQVIRLLGLLGAALLARGLAPLAAGRLESSMPGADPRLVHGVLWIVAFIAGVAAFAALGRLGRRALEAMQLGPLDRVGGLLAGVITGLLVHAALVAGLLQVGSRTWAAESVRGTRSGQLVDALTHELPLLYDRASSAVGELQEAGALDGAAQRLESPREDDSAEALTPNRVR
jgi:uncharacterized membrane protein required for colicin V production